MNFYKTIRWLAKRKKILNRDDHMCRECKRYGKTTAASTVHHIIPMEERPDLKLEDKNLLSLCNNCHNGMHDRIGNALTAKGLEWVERMYPPHPKH